MPTEGVAPSCRMEIGSTEGRVSSTAACVDAYPSICLGEMSIWGGNQVSDDGTMTFSVGDFALTVQRHGREWLFSHRLGEATGDDQTEPSPDRYLAADRSSLLTLSPFMPDRPVVVAAGTRFALGAGVEARFYVEIPVWVRATVGGDPRRILFDTPTRRLSNTWFGGVMTGRLCYSLDRPMVFHREELTGQDDTAVCTVRFRNQSRSQFSSGKVAVFADLLRVYRRSERLWTNDAIATVVAPDQLSLSVGEELPFPKAELEQLADSRVPAGENIVRKGLILLKTITNT